MVFEKIVLNAVAKPGTIELSGWANHQPNGLNEEINEENLRKKKKIMGKWGKMRKVELLPTQDCETGYTPVQMPIVYPVCKEVALFLSLCNVVSTGDDIS